MSHIGQKITAPNKTAIWERRFGPLIIGRFNFTDSVGVDSRGKLYWDWR